MKFHASDIQISFSGTQFFQLSISETKAEDCQYVLLQNSFEFFQDAAYFECHNLDLTGHGRVKFCELRKESLEVDVIDSTERITVTFNEPDEIVGNLAWILRIIFAKSISFVNSSGVLENPIKDSDYDEY